MIEVTKTSLGFNVPVKYYESESEADRDGGKTGLLLLEGNNNLYYRGGCADECREIIADVVEKRTGMKRETQQVTRKVKKDGQEVVEAVKDKDGNPVLEYVLDEEPYVKLALATAKLTSAELQDDITAAIRAANEGQGVRVDIRKKERKPSGPKTLAEKYLVAARGLIESGKIAQFAKDYRRTCGKDLSEEQRKDATAVGWTLKEFLEARANEYLTAK